MASDGAVAFRYVCPTGVISESDKDAQGALIGACDKYDLIAFMKSGGHRFRVLELPSIAIPFSPSQAHGSCQ